jgi:hypothetical protein
MMLRGWRTSVHFNAILYLGCVGAVGRQVMIRYKSGSRSRRDVIWLNSHRLFFVGHHEIKPQSVATFYQVESTMAVIAMTACLIVPTIMSKRSTMAPWV